MNQLTVYELMAEDMEIFAQLKNNKQIKIEIFNEDNQLVFEEETHRCAWDALVDIARQIISINKRLEDEEQMEIEEGL